MTETTRLRGWLPINRRKRQSVLAI